MTTYRETTHYKSTEFYNIAPAGFFSLYNNIVEKRCLCFKVAENLFLNLETKECINVADDDLDDMVEIVRATVTWEVERDI